MPTSNDIAGSSKKLANNLEETVELKEIENANLTGSGVKITDEKETDHEEKKRNNTDSSEEGESCRKIDLSEESDDDDDDLRIILMKLLPEISQIEKF